MRRCGWWACWMWLACSSVTVCAAEVKVAVASNFAAPMHKLAALFMQETGHKVLISLGSTGGFYAQIQQGAPFELLLAADQQTPLMLEQQGLSVPGTRYTYAVGQLVLWSKTPGLVDPQGDVLRRGNFHKLALANPKVAPYGRAAVEVMTAMGLLSSLKDKWVQGENIAQVHQFVLSENATLGFVALSQVQVQGQLSQGSAWIVPERWYSPIRQDAILLKQGKDHEAARALWAYLRSDSAKAVIRSFGYTF